MKYFMLIITLSHLISCSMNKTESCNESEWRLSWRMVYNSSKEDYLLAEKQFDSLLFQKVKMSEHVLLQGIKVKSKRGKIKEAISLLRNYPDSYLRAYCNFKDNLLQQICHNIPQEEVKYPKLRKEIIVMYHLDQIVRGNKSLDLIDKYEIDSIVIKKALTNGTDSDEINVESLKLIIHRYGFPTKLMIGSDAMKGVFYIIQHARDQLWQERMLPYIAEAVKNKSLKADTYAYLVDRIKMRKGEKQIYGSQFNYNDKGILELYPVEDSLNLDNRRMKTGMSPISSYKYIISTKIR